MAFDVLPPIIITRKEVRIFQHLKDLDTLINGNISHHSIDLDTVSHCAVSLSNMLYTLLSTGSTQEDRKSSWHDWQIVDWDVKHQYKQLAHFFLK